MIPDSYDVYEAVDVFDDYVAIATYIERWTEDRVVADRTVDAIRSFVKSLSIFPHRGTCREDPLLGLRVVPFGKRTAIAFTVDEIKGRVNILRVFYGGQDYEAVMRDPAGVPGTAVIGHGALSVIGGIGEHAAQYALLLRPTPHSLFCQSRCRAALGRRP